MNTKPIFVSATVSLGVSLRVAVAVAVALAPAAGCKKDSKAKSWEEQLRPADVVKQNREAAPALTAPAMMAAIPADTPYLFGAFEPLPAGYIDALLEKDRGEIRKALEELRDNLRGAGHAQIRDVHEQQQVQVPEQQQALDQQALDQQQAQPPADPRRRDQDRAGAIRRHHPAKKKPSPDDELEPIVIGEPIGHLHQAEPEENITGGLVGDAPLTGPQGIARGDDEPVLEGKARQVVLAVLDEVLADFSTAGFERLGFDTNPRFAIYGVGWVPVFRVELADAGRMRATFERVAGAAGVELPERTAGGARYWHVGEESDDINVAFGIAGSDLVVTAATPRVLALVAPVAFGGVSGASMADGGALVQLAAEYGFSGHGIGYLDTRRLLDLLLGDGPGVGGQIAAIRQAEDDDPPPSAACVSAARELAAMFPRLVVGVEKMNASELTTLYVVETSPAIADVMQSVQARVPGMTAELPGKPVIAVGAALDFDKLRGVMDRARVALEPAAAACIDQDAVADMRRDQQEWLEDMPKGIKGAFAMLASVDTSGDAPGNLQGYAVVAARDAGVLVDEAVADGLPLPRGIKANGEWHTLPIGGFVPMVDEAKLSLRKDAAVVTAGEEGYALARRALADSARSPFLILAYDAPRFQELLRSALGGLFAGFGGDGDDPLGLSGYGRVELVVFPSAKGLMTYAKLAL